MHVYLASSWRNEFYAEYRAVLLARDHEVYDFKDPAGAFQWSDIDNHWLHWSVNDYIEILFDHPEARRGFVRDMDALAEAEAVVMLMPCGQSAHLEAGWAKGAGKPLAIVIPSRERWEPDLMYAMADLVTTDIHDVADWLESLR